LGEIVPLVTRGPWGVREARGNLHLRKEGEFGQRREREWAVCLTSILPNIVTAQSCPSNKTSNKAKLKVEAA
jgi:hypothetical protein